MNGDGRWAGAATSVAGARIRWGVTRRRLLECAAAGVLGWGSWLSRLAETDAAASPTGGGTLRIGVTGGWATLDPPRYTNVSERQIFYSIYSPLVSLNPDFSIGPGLVRTWTIAPDGLRVTFQLQPGVQFHDGTPCDAAAVKFNIDRILDPATGSAFRTILAPVKDVRVANPTTVELALTQPFTPLLSWFTEGPGFISSPAAVRKWGAEYGQHPVGTGPFSFAEWVKDDHITLKKFPGFWQRGTPYLDELVYRPLNDETVKMADLQAGSLDIVDTIPAQKQRAIRSDAQFRTIILPGTRWPLIRLNNARPPFSNKALRQAVSYAVDRVQIVTAIYFDQARAAYGPISPVYRGYYDPSVAQYGYEHNAQKAKAKLAEGGQPNGFSFTLEIFASPEQTRLAELIKAQLAEVGITANIQAYEVTTLISRVTAKRFEAMIGSWTPRPDIDGTMYNHFSSRGNVNSVSYRNAAVDDLLEKTRTVPNGPERVRLYREIQRLIVQDAPWVFLVFENLMLGMRKDVQGYPAIPDSMMRLQSVWKQA